MNDGALVRGNVAVSAVPRVHGDSARIGMLATSIAVSGMHQFVRLSVRLSVASIIHSVCPVRRQHLSGPRRILKLTYRRAALDATSTRFVPSVRRPTTLVVPVAALLSSVAGRAHSPYQLE